VRTQRIFWEPHSTVLARTDYAGLPKRGDFGDEFGKNVLIASAAAREQLHLARGVRDEDAEAVVLQRANPPGAITRTMLKLKLRTVV